ncbi:MAG: DMT family transporter [Chlamydiales bacterium]
MVVQRRSFSLGIFYMTLSATSFSFAYLFAKLAADEMNLALLIFLRFLIPFALIVLFYIWKKQSIKTPYLRVHALRAFFVMVSQYSIFYYLTKEPLMNAAMLLNTSPIFIPLLEWIFLNYRIPKSTWISIAIGVVGVFLILQPGISLITPFSFFGLLAGITQAASQVIYGINVRREPTELNLFYLYCFGTIFSLIPLPIIFWKYRSISLFFELKPDLLLFLFLLSFANVANQYFRGEAYQQKKPSTLSVFLYLSVLISALFDWSIFGREPDLYSIIGAILIILGGASKIFLRYLFLKK